MIQGEVSATTSIWSTLPSWIALGVTVVVLGFQIWYYLRPLQMDITYVHVAQILEHKSLVLFRLSLINNSSRGRVVYNIVPKSKTENVTLEKAFQEFDLNSRAVVYKLTKDSLGFPLPIVELQPPPLDIPPHQTRSTWHCLVVQVNRNPSQVESPKAGEILPEQFAVELHVEGINIDGKTITKTKRDKTIYPMRLASSPTYETYTPPRFELPDIFFILEPPFVFFWLIFVILLSYFLSHNFLK